MKRLYSGSRLTVILVFLILLPLLSTGCAGTEYTGPEFSGGETLTPEIMESIRDHIYASETEKYPVITDENGYPVVYWVTGGSVWHYNPGCSSIRSSSGVISGTAEDAIAAGKDHPCSKCTPPELRVFPAESVINSVISK